MNGFSCFILRTDKTRRYRLFIPYCSHCYANQRNVSMPVSGKCRGEGEHGVFTITRLCFSETGESERASSVGICATS